MVDRGDHLPAEIRPIETPEYSLRVTEKEGGLDFFPHSGGGGGSEGQNRHRKEPPKLSDAEVGRPEVVPPV